MYVIGGGYKSTEWRTVPRFNITCYHSLLLRLLGGYLAIAIVENLLNLDTTQMIKAFTQLAVMVEQPPPPLKLDDGMMGGPAQNGLENAAGVGKGAQRAFGCGVDEVMRIARRITKVVGFALLVHPGRLEEAAIMVVGPYGLTRLGGQDDEIAHVAVELAHVVAQLGHLGKQGILVVTARLLGPQPARVELVGPVLVALQLAAPQAAKVQVGLPVAVDEGRGVDAEATADGVRVRHEWTLGRVGHGDANAEDGVLVARGEVEVVLSVLAGGVGGPELLGNPGDVLGLEHDAVVDYGVGGVQGRGAEDVVVSHVVLVAIVIELDAGVTVVRGVDVDAVVEDVGRGVGCVEVGY